MSRPNLVILGASTGGPKILRRFFMNLPVIDAAVVLVQHMPKFVNDSVVRTLSELTPMDVHLARDGGRLKPGTVTVAPSEVHTKIINGMSVSLVDGEKVNFVKPAVDVTMKSVTRRDAKLVSVIFTGMGCDGADGLAHMKDLGATTYAQDSASSVIYGMPKAAVDTGKVDFVMPPEQIRDSLIQHFGVLAGV